MSWTRRCDLLPWSKYHSHFVAYSFYIRELGKLGCSTVRKGCVYHNWVVHVFSCNMRRCSKSQSRGNEPQPWQKVQVLLRDLHTCEEYSELDRDIVMFLRTLLQIGPATWPTIHRLPAPAWKTAKSAIALFYAVNTVLLLLGCVGRFFWHPRLVSRSRVIFVLVAIVGFA